MKILTKVGLGFASIVVVSLSFTQFIEHKKIQESEYERDLSLKMMYEMSKGKQWSESIYIDSPAYPQLADWENSGNPLPQILFALPNEETGQYSMWAADIDGDNVQYLMTEDELGVVSEEFDYLSRSPNGRYIGFTDEDYHFNLFDLKTRQIVASIEGGKGDGDEGACARSLWNIDSSQVVVNCLTSAYSINTKDYRFIRAVGSSPDSYRQAAWTQGRLAYNKKNNTLYTAQIFGHFYYHECESYEYRIQPPYTSCANGMIFDFSTLEYQDKGYYYRESISPLDPDEGSCNLRGDLTGNYFTCLTVAEKGEGVGIYSFDDYKNPVAFARGITQDFYLHTEVGYWYKYSKGLNFQFYHKPDDSPVQHVIFNFQWRDFFGELEQISKFTMTVSSSYMKNHKDVDLSEHLPSVPTYGEFRHALETRNEQ
ncbi:hypothetical protein N9R79_12075 [Vibrio sp.]|nr:hypothetical protein [Vibrio sp.]